MSELPPAGWQVQARPPVMTRRFDFPDYAATRSFLDGLTRLSETSGYYPDLNFAKTHVSVTLAAREATLGADEYDFASGVDALAIAPPNPAAG
jgi:4a-hydroxytetrahydrobiopterin dehydratase